MRVLLLSRRIKQLFGQMGVISSRFGKTVNLLLKHSADLAIQCHGLKALFISVLLLVGGMGWGGLEAVKFL